MRWADGVISGIRDQKKKKKKRRRIADLFTVGCLGARFMGLFFWSQSDVPFMEKFGLLGWMDSHEWPCSAFWSQTDYLHTWWRGVHPCSCQYFSSVLGVCFLCRYSDFFFLPGKKGSTLDLCQTANMMKMLLFCFIYPFKLCHSQGHIGWYPPINEKRVFSLETVKIIIHLKFTSELEFIWLFGFGTNQEKCQIFTCKCPSNEFLSLFSSVSRYSWDHWGGFTF